MTTSGGWPPEPPHERAPDEHVGAHAGGWGDPADQGWPDGAGGWPADTRPAADDDWEAVQASWRRQNGLPTEDEPANGALSQRHGGRHDDWGAPQASAAPDPWGPPGRPRRAAVGSVGHAAGPHAGPPSDPWGAAPANGAGRHSDPWGTPPAQRGSAVGSVGHGAGQRCWGVTPIRGARRRPTAPAPRPTRGARPWGRAAPPSPDPWGGAPNRRGPGGPRRRNPRAPGAPWSGLSAGTWGGPGAGQTGPMWDDPAVSPSTDDPWGPPTALAQRRRPRRSRVVRGRRGARRPARPAPRGPSSVRRRQPAGRRPRDRPLDRPSSSETGCRPSGPAAAGRAARSRSCWCRCPTARSPSCRTAAR